MSVSTPTLTAERITVDLDKISDIDTTTTVLVFGPESSYNTPFVTYEHCIDGDWGVYDRGRFNSSINHGFSRRGAQRFAVEMYRRALDEHFPRGSTARSMIAFELGGKRLACTCPLGDPCHVDALVELIESVPALCGDSADRA